MSQNTPKKKITISQLKKYLPIQRPPCGPKLPQSITRYLLSPTFSNLSITEQNVIKAKYQIAYRNYYSIDDVIAYLDQLTQRKYMQSSIRRAVCNCAEKYGVVNWYKFIRKVMDNRDQIAQQIEQPRQVNKIVLVDKIKFIFRSYLTKRKIWRGFEEVADTKRSLDARVLDQLSRQAIKQVKQFIQRNRVHCQKVLYQAEKQNPKTINFITLQKIINSELQMYMDRKKVIYLYNNFDHSNKGFFKTQQLLDKLLVIPKQKPIKKQSYYLTDFQQLMERIRAQFNALFYSAHDMENDFDDFYLKKIKERSLQDGSIEEDQIDADVFYQYVSDKCENRYSRYFIDKIHNLIKFRKNIHFLYNKPNLADLSKSVLKQIEKQRKKRILKKQNTVFYSYRTIILNLITRCKSPKLTRQKLAQLMVDIDPHLMYKSFFCIWRVYPEVINVERIKKQSGLNPLACYFKLRRTEEQYQKMWETLHDLMPADAIVTYDKLQEKINMNLEFVLDVTKIKPLNLGKYDQINYCQGIKKIFQPDFQLDIRAYIHRKVSEKAYALWKGYKSRKQSRQRLQRMTKNLVKDLIPNAKASIDSSVKDRKLKSQKSKSSLKSKKQLSLNPQSVQIVKWNIDKLLFELPLSQGSLRRQFHKNEHTRDHLCVNLRQSYDYRTLTPRYVMHAIPGIIGMGSQLMFLKKNKAQTIKIKFFYKPEIQVIDFVTLGNDIVILTSYFTLQFYSLAQDSNYSYQTIQLLDEVKNISINDLDNICQDRSYSRYPIFIRNSQKNLLVNTAIINNQIMVVSSQTNSIAQKIQFSQKQHVLNKSSIKILDQIAKSSRKSQICAELIKEFARSEPSLSSFKTIFNEQSQNQEKQDLDNVLRLSESQIKNFMVNMLGFSPALIACILKQQLNLLKKVKFPQSLTSVLNQLMHYMQFHNISLANVIQQIDREGQNVIKIKALKDYLLKITFKVYQQNQKEIDAILKNMAVGKNVQYDAFCEIMNDWQYKVWERPNLIIRDFAHIHDSNLLIYTLESDTNVYVKNMEDNLLIAILKGHKCAPSIYFIPQSYILVTGDLEAIRIWRIYQDLINKYNESPPWEISPFATISNAHNGLITSILYLPRAHCIVTTSLDCTAKFWRIKQQKDQSKQYLQQIKRFYSNQWVYLSSKCNTILLDQQGCRLELLALAKISKQINENNKYKYEMKVQVFQVEKTVIKTGPNNIYLDLPPKLKLAFQQYVDSLGVKKNVLLAKAISQIQNKTTKNNLISESLQKTLYQSVKNCFIFQEFSQLYNICDYLSKKNISNQIVQTLFQKFGIGIPKTNQFAPLHKRNQSVDRVIRPEEAGYIFQQAIELSQDQIQCFMNKLQKMFQQNSSMLKTQQILTVASQFLNVVHFQKFQSILNELIKDKEKKQIRIDQLKTIFKPLHLDSQLDRLYAILRSVNILIRQKGLKIWNIFTNNKSQLEKKKRISQIQFQKFMSTLNISNQKIKLITSYLSRGKTVSLDDLIYYTKLAWQAVGYEMNQSNFSKIFMKNSRFLQSKLQNFKLDNGIQVQVPEFDQKLKSLQSSAIQNQSRQSLGSRRSSRKLLRQVDPISQTNSVDKDSNQKKKSLSKSQMQKQQQAGNSVPISSSNSRVSLSHESNAKDDYTKQIRQIVKKIKQMLRNEGKSIWDICSLSIPEFMENHLISQSQFFNILAMIRSPIYLRDKLKLMAYIMKQSNQFSAVDINLLFELFETSQSAQRWTGKNQPVTIPGQKYIISHFIARVTENNLVLQHCLSMYLFNSKEELTIQQIISRLSQNPFKMLNFCLKQFQNLLLNQNKSAFTIQQMQALIEDRVRKFNIKVDSKQITMIQQILHQIENRGVKLQQLIPKAKTNNGIINYATFYAIISQFYHEKQIIIQNQFVKIVMFIQEQRKNQEKQKLNQSPVRFSKAKPNAKNMHKSSKQQNHEQLLKNSTVKYKQLLNYVNKMMEEIKKSSNSQKDGVKKFLKGLQNKKLSLLMFFVSLDRNRNFFINQIQFVAGLAQLNVSQNFWPSIKKKNSKKLFYYQLINYLVQNQFVNYKCVDSQLQAAMTKFVRRFVRNDDIEAVFDRVRAKDSSQPYNATFSSFQNALKLSNLFKQQEMQYIFGAFVNADNLKNSSFSNDNLIKDLTNVHKSFNFKMFTDVVNMYKNENITKTPHYKLCHFFKKRGISLLNQFVKWMQRNKKIKQIAQAIKIKQFTLPKQLYVNFLKELGTQLQQKDIKQLLSGFPNPLQFSNLNQKLQQIYKKGNSNVQTEQITAYLQQIYRKIKKLNVTTARLFQDFTEDKFKMDNNNFSQLIRFLELGLTKIQNKMIFNFVDLQKKGFITLNQLQNALQDASQSMDKEEDEFQLDYIIEKLVLNRQKYILKSSRISYNYERALIIFANVLTSQQIILLNKSAQQHFKTNQLTQKNIEQFIESKQKQAKAKKDKKYKQLILNFLKFMKKANIDVVQAYNYFSKDTNSLTKNKFLIEYQSLGLKATILQINALYSYLDEAKLGTISLQKWEDKLNVIEYEKDNSEGATGEQLQIFYKVKLVLADIYLIFVRKLFKSKQIAAYFDINGNGELSYQQFISSVTKLGMHLQQNIEGKLINYLDKQRLGKIVIKNLVYQIQNCLSSKAKLILETKTSCIFKEKVHLIQQKQGYFIQRLVGSEHFIERNEKLQSCILITNFIDIIKDFGIVLGEDEFNDVQRNFMFNKENLLLYPLYFMFINIFRSFENSLSSDEMERIRYQKLFNIIVKNGLSMKIFDKIQSIKQATIFLSQLKLFTPIQIKMMVQSVTIAGSNLIDPDLLRQKTRDSFLQSGQLSKSVLMSQFSSKRNNVMKQWLRQQIDPIKVTKILNANSGKIKKDTFQSLLIKSGVILKKSDVYNLFNIFGRGDDYVLIEQLINETDSEDERLDKIVQEKEEETGYSTLLLNHICKSLDFKGVSLEEAWEKYFTNFGFISQQSFYLFLSEIGFDYKQKRYENIVPNFLALYKTDTNLSQLKSLEVEQIMKIKNQIPQKLCSSQQYKIKSESVENLSELVHSSSQFFNQFEQFVQEQGINSNRISAAIIYQYLKNFVKNSKSRVPISQKQIQFYANLVIDKKQMTLNQFTQNVRNLILKSYKLRNKKYSKTQQDDQSIIINVPSSSSLQKNANRLKTQALSLDQSVKKICQQNFIFSYQTLVEHFQKYINSLQIPIDNCLRICLNLVIENLLQNDYLLFIKPKLNEKALVIPIEKHKRTHSHHLSHQSSQSVKFNLKTLANLIIQKEELIPEKAVYLVNQKFYGMNVSEKKDFQTFAIVSNMLDSQLVFIRAKNYYLWQPNASPMPKTSINFRWKFIPIVLLKIAKQFYQLQQHHYALPHLRWQYLNSKNGISRPIFPCQADSTGRLHTILHENLLKLDDPYCPPQIFRKTNPVTLKLNTWILGCIMYEFIWGHSPNSFILLLLQYIEGRHSEYELADVLKMEEMPSDFRYTPFKYNKIKEILTFQHELKAQGIPDDLQNNVIYFGLRGLIKNLQILYGSQYMYYSKQFDVFQKLHEIIIDCLDATPETRPNIKQIVERLSSLLEEEDYRDFNLTDYIQVLNKHHSAQYLNKNLIDAIKTDFLKGDSSHIQKLSQQFYEQIRRIKSKEKVKQIYIIPKKYPWPDKQTEQVYEQQLLLNRVSIRSNRFYSTICSIQNENCLQMLINLYVQQLKEHSNQEASSATFSNILKSLMLIIQMLRTYETPFAGYIPQILQSFLQLFYRQQFHFTSTPAASPNKNLLILTNKNQREEQAALNFIKNVVYLNGNANIEYLPVCHFMQGSPKYRKLFQFFYASIDLSTPSNINSSFTSSNSSFKQKMQLSMERKILAISYFRDKVYDEHFWDIVKYLKIDILMLQLLDDPDLAKFVLMFFKDITSHSNCIDFALIDSNIFYLKLGVIITENLNNFQNKSEIVQIATNILRLKNQNLVKRMNEPCFGLLKEIFKLLVEPFRETPQHEEFMQMHGVLSMFVDAFKNCVCFSRELNKIEGGQTILRAFQNVVNKQD